MCLHWGAAGDTMCAAAASPASPASSMMAGPFWVPFATAFSPRGGADDCERDWAYVLTYTNNFLPFDDDGDPSPANCIGWTW